MESRHMPQACSYLNHLPLAAPESATIVYQVTPATHIRGELDAFSYLLAFVFALAVRFGHTLGCVLNAKDPARSVYPPMIR
jgi:hypothetical protein